MVYNLITEKGREPNKPKRVYIMEKIIIHNMTGENPNKTKTVICDEKAKEAKHVTSENFAIIGDNIVTIGVGRGSFDTLHCFKF